MKFKINDLAYKISVTDCLVVTVSECLIENIENYTDKKTRYQLKVLKNIVYRDYEISVSKEKQLENSFDFILNDSRKPNLITGSYGESIIYKKVTVKIIEKEIEKKKKSLKKQEEYNLKREQKFRCPITGEKLIKQPEHGYILDGPTTYIVENHSEISYEVWPRGGLDVFYQTNSEKRIFKIDWKTYKWKELIRLGDKLIDIPKTKKAWKKYNNEVERLRIEKEKRDRQYEEDIKSGKIKPLFNIKRVESVLTNSEMVEVKPMSAPSGLLYFAEPSNKTEYPETVESTIKELE